MKKQILSIHYLRGFAALLVAVHHTGWTRNFLGASRVDLFFIISGFIMVFVAKREATPQSFLWARFCRIVPFYWLMTIATAFIYNYAWDQTLTSMMFSPYTRDTMLNWPIMFQGWTLNYEVFFYAIFASSLLLVKHRLAYITSLIVALVLVGFAFKGNTIFTAYTNPLMLEFVFGMWLCQAWKNGYMLKGKYAYCAIAVAAVVLAFQYKEFPSDLQRVVCWGVPWAFVVSSLLGVEAAGKMPNVPMAKFLGNISFSLYLVHIWVLDLTRSTLVVLPAPIAVGIYLCVCVLFAWVLNVMVEKPLLNVFRPRAKVEIKLA